MLNMEGATRTTTMNKAVTAAHQIIKSRTGVTIIRQSYNRGKKNGRGRTQENFNLKELRKLQQNKRQYSQKLEEAGSNPEQRQASSPVESPSKTKVGEAGKWASPRTHRKVKTSAEVKHEDTSSPPPNAALLDERREEVATNILVRLPTPFENCDSELREDKEINNDIEEQEQPGKLLNNKVTTNSQIRLYHENWKVSTWLASIDEAIPSSERDPAVATLSSTSSRKHRDAAEADSKTNIREESSVLPMPSTTDKPPKSATLTLPKISCSNSSVSVRVSRSRKMRRTDSLNDPRFTQLLQTLTSVNGTLKLPPIVKTEEERKD